MSEILEAALWGAFGGLLACEIVFLFYVLITEGSRRIRRARSNRQRRRREKPSVRKLPARRATAGEEEKQKLSPEEEAIQALVSRIAKKPL